MLRLHYLKKDRSISKHCARYLAFKLAHICVAAKRGSTTNHQQLRFVATCTNSASWIGIGLGVCLGDTMETLLGVVSWMWGINNNDNNTNTASHHMFEDRLPEEAQSLPAVLPDRITE